METGHVLVIKQGPDDPIDDVWHRLAKDDAITLATPVPVDIDRALAIIGQRPEIAVVLVVGRDAGIPSIVSAVRTVRDDIHIIALAVETGTASLSLRDPNFQELNRIILSLAEPPARAGPGRILRFKPRVASGGWTKGPSLGETAGPAENLPVPVVVELDHRALDLIDQALEWVEEATRVLLDVWSPGKDDAPGFVPGREILVRLLGGFTGLFGKSAERPERLFDRLVAALRRDENVHTPLAVLYGQIDEDPRAFKIFLIAAASDFDIRFHRLFGALHDDLSRRYPSVALACAIVAAGIGKATPAAIRGDLAINAALRRLGIVPETGPAALSGDAPLRLPATLIDWLLTGDREALFGADVARLRRPAQDEAAGLLSLDRMRRVRAVVRHALIGRDRISAIFLTGSAPGWTIVDAASLAEHPLIVGPPPMPIAVETLAESLAELARAARLADWHLIFDLGDDSPSGDALWSALSAAWPLFADPPYVIAANPAKRLASVPDAQIVAADLPAVTRKERQDAIAAALARHNVEDDVLAGQIADTFPLPLDRVPQAITLALGLAATAGRPNRPEAEDWLGGFRRMAGARLPSLARRVEPAPRPDGDPPAIEAVVLPAGPRSQLRELISHVRHTRVVLEDWGYGALTDGCGVAALFSGDSGTGKTTAAHAIAAELGADLYVIELAQVVSKYIGETEKNLDIIFDDAQDAGAVLLFDEADALFGKRSSVNDAHDRYANIEVAYLLQRIQRFTGLAILTTNNAEGIDPAFTRRLRFKVDFPRPSAADRLLIWEQSIPVHLRAEPLDLRAIAFALDVTGGIIRQMALHAAMLAAEAGGLIQFGQVLAGARSQVVRLGRYADLARIDAIAGTRTGKEAA